MNLDDTYISVGDRVLWRGCWCTDPEREVTVIGLEITPLPRMKQGDYAQACTLREHQENRVVYSLDNHHWAYATQIRAL